jgi:hypothetical protein
MMRHGIQEEPARRGRTRMPHLCLDGDLKKVYHLPHEKSTLNKFTKKLAAFRALENCHGPFGAI